MNDYYISTASADEQINCVHISSCTLLDDSGTRKYLGKYHSHHGAVYTAKRYFKVARICQCCAPRYDKVRSAFV